MQCARARHAVPLQGRQSPIGRIACHNRCVAGHCLYGELHAVSEHDRYPSVGARNAVPLPVSEHGR